MAQTFSKLIRHDDIGNKKESSIPSYYYFKTSVQL